MSSAGTKSSGTAEPAGAPEDRFATQLRGFGPLGIVAILLIFFSNFQFPVPGSSLPIFVPAGAMLVLLWARWSHTPWNQIGYTAPRNWISTVAIGIVFGIALKFLMKAIVMPLFGADPINQPYHFLAGNRSALPAAMWAMIVSAGWGEETVFRGFLFERLRRLLGANVFAKASTVLITSILFGLAHYSNQGITGVEQATIVGLLFGIVFASTGQIWMLVCAHAAFDLTALAMIYWNLETRVAHLVFH